jgi:hypothetical protein
MVILCCTSNPIFGLDLPVGTMDFGTFVRGLSITAKKASPASLIVRATVGVLVTSPNTEEGDSGRFTPPLSDLLLLFVNGIRSVVSLSRVYESTK